MRLAFNFSKAARNRSTKTTSPLVSRDNVPCAPKTSSNAAIVVKPAHRVTLPYDSHADPGLAGFRPCAVSVEPLFGTKNPIAYR